MSACSQCGAPIELVADRSVKCTYCGATNAPAPREVAVPVPVQLIHNVVVAPAATPDTAGARCPHCRKILHGVKVADIELSGCGGCGGIWIDNAGARHVVAHPEPIFGELANRCAANAKGQFRRADRPQCPVCPAVLDQVMTHNIQLDICPDHGTWFDANELFLLVETLAGRVAEPIQLRPGSQAMIHCARCRAKIRADQANVTEVGLTCEPCWRSLQSEQLARADAQQATTAGTAFVGIAAVLLGAAAASSSDS